MSAPGPESIPTSADPRSQRPTKKRALTPSSAHAASLDALFARPDKQIPVPSATGARPAGPLAPEIVASVQGSSSGAGSGEFHVYKASRRREYDRLKDMDDELRSEKSRAEFAAARAERATKDEEKTRKNREKREKSKARKGNKGNSIASGNATPSSTNGSIATTVKDNNHQQSGDATKEPDNGRAAREPSQEQDNAAIVSNPNPPSVGLVIHDDD